MRNIILLISSLCIICISSEGRLYGAGKLPLSLARLIIKVVLINMYSVIFINSFPRKIQAHNYGAIFVRVIFVILLFSKALDLKVGNSFFVLFCMKFYRLVLG